MTHLLAAAYGTVAVPPAVVAEVAPDLPDLSPFTWLMELRLMSQATTAALRRARPALHAGEAEAIALAIELDCPLIIDERLGSRAAIEHGVHKVGILGLLVASKLEGLLPAVRPVIDELIGVDFRASPQLLDQILRMAGET